MTGNPRKEHNNPMQRGFAPVYLLIGIVMLATLGGTYYFGKSIISPKSNQPKACTQEAKQCPDGSYVGRTEPNCEFKPCPTSNPPQTQDRAKERETYAEATPNPDISGCKVDSDCDVNTCSCTAARRDTLTRNMCLVMCPGEPKCINNKCELVKESTQETFCGGFTGKSCPNGYTCQLDGNYPDAGGKCIKE